MGWVVSSVQKGELRKSFDSFHNFFGPGFPRPSPLLKFVVGINFKSFSLGSDMSGLKTVIFLEAPKFVSASETFWLSL